MEDIGGDDTDSYQKNHGRNYSNQQDCPTWTLDDYYAFNWTKFWVEAVLINIVSTVGLLLNIFAIIALTNQKSIKNVFNYLMIILMYVDSVYLFINITRYTLDHIIYSDRLYNQVFPHFLYPANNITMMASIWLTVALSHERYVAILRPMVHRARMESGKYRRLHLMKYIIPIFLMSILFNVPTFFDISIYWQPKTSTDGSLWWSEKIRNLTYLETIRGPPGNINR